MIVRPLRAAAAMALLPALAMADPVFVQGGRVGLSPPPGFTQSARFAGFENPATQASFMITELPREAWAQLKGSMTKEALAGQGVEIASRETLTVANSEAMLLRGTQSLGSVTADKWILIVGYPTATALVTFQAPGAGAKEHSADSVRQALLSVAFRSPMTMSEQVAALPFKIGAATGFRVDRVLGGHSVILVEENAPAGPPEALFVVAASVGPSPAEAERDAFAEQVLRGLAALRLDEVESKAALLIGGDSGHELVARGTEGRTGSPVVIVQWLRFRPNGYWRYVGVAPQPARDRLLPSFRSMRDAITPKE